MITTVLVVIQNWGDINKFINPPPDFSAAHGGIVILYATSWCGYCVKARKLLEENNVEYFEYDIEKSTEGKRQHKALGGSGIPVLLINGETIKGYNPELILKLLKTT